MGNILILLAVLLVELGVLLSILFLALRIARRRK
jgi:hypothetical protein